MYIYHVLINTLSVHTIHFNLNMIFYTYVEHSPTKRIYVKYYMEKTNKHAKHARPHTHTHTHRNSNVYDTDLYHTPYTRTCAPPHTHTRTHIHD